MSIANTSVTALAPYRYEAEDFVIEASPKPFVWRNDLNCRMSVRFFGPSTTSAIAAGLDDVAKSNSKYGVIMDREMRNLMGEVAAV